MSLLLRQIVQRLGFVRREPISNRPFTHAEYQAMAQVLARHTDDPVPSVDETANVVLRRLETIADPQVLREVAWELQRRGIPIKAAPNAGLLDDENSVPFPRSLWDLPVPPASAARELDSDDLQESTSYKIRARLAVALSQQDTSSGARVR